MKLDEYLKENNLSANELAKRADVHVSSITRFLRKERCFSLDTAIKIMQATNGTVAITELTLNQETAA